MADSTTIARPYAKAIFEHALDANKLSVWSEILHNLSMAISDKKLAQFISNPSVTKEQQIELLMALFDKPNFAEKETAQNFIALLVKNKRLMSLPTIQILFEIHRAEQEKTLEVDVVSYSELNKAQQEALISKLSKKLKRQVNLNLKIDEDLLGGAVIHAGDLVIDGSLRGRLQKLNAELAA
ncbi:MAG: F0F1 ATP synthase subunit delta [Proteobacteria bacterium]|nr:F0F1 ATP synthase subunit delta [Pseudomonadota bacterium]